MSARNLRDESKRVAREEWMIRARLFNTDQDAEIDTIFRIGILRYRDKSMKSWIFFQLSDIEPNAKNSPSSLFLF